MSESGWTRKLKHPPTSLFIPVRPLISLWTPRTSRWGWSLKTKAFIKRKKPFLTIYGVNSKHMKDLFDKILVFDLDDTIIDTRGIKIILFGIANELGIRDEATLEIYKRARDNGFTLEKFAQELSEATGQGGDEIKRRMEQAILERRAELFFPDAKD